MGINRLAFDQQNDVHGISVVEIRVITVLWEDRELNHLTEVIRLGEQIGSRCLEQRQKLSEVAPMVLRYRRLRPVSTSC